MEVQHDLLQEELEHFKSMLSENRYRVTKSRLAIAKTMIANEELFLTPEEIYHIVLDQERISCDLASVYRTLWLLQELDLVSKNELYGEATRFSWRGSQQPARIAHTHYFMCNRCHRVDPLSDCSFPSIASTMEKLGYTNLSHRFEVRGICPDCR